MPPPFPPGSAPPPSIWNRPPRGARGPAPVRSREEIAATAVALADSGGLDAVSMRAVAAALDTTAGSLYRYLSSREDLLDLMTDRVAGELRPFPELGGGPDRDWLEGMSQLARRQLDLCRRHPWLVQVLPRPSAPGPQTLAWLDHCLAVLRPVPAPAPAKLEAIAVVTGIVTLFARNQSAGPPPVLPDVDQASYPDLAAALTGPAAASGPRELFDATVRSVLRGLLPDGGS